MLKTSLSLFTTIITTCLTVINVHAQRPAQVTAPSATNSIFLGSKAGTSKAYEWQMINASEAGAEGKQISKPGYHTGKWQRAIVPGTVLNSLVANKVYPDPYYSDNNRKSKKLIPDIADAGREFYHYWFRRSFTVPSTLSGKRTWLKFHGINYSCQIWLNGHKLGNMEGMFNAQSFDITNIVNRKGANVLAVDMLPVDHPGTSERKNNDRVGAVGENRNGGDGEIGKDVTMLMSVGWDFTIPDGVRDRNTGIWRDVELYTTGNVTMDAPFVMTKMDLPDTSHAQETVTVELQNASGTPQSGSLTGRINEAGISFSKKISLLAHEKRTITFSPKEFKQLNIQRPKLWWPVNKGKPHLYTMSLQFRSNDGTLSHSSTTRFGIRQVTSDQNTPDSSRRFLVNGVPVFIRGTNWVPEAMLRNSTERTYAELRYTRQAGVNLLRLWGGGIAESDYFYQLCDEFGLMVWNEFWLTGDTRFPVDTALYLRNVENTVKRIRKHPSVAYYVAANEAKEVPGTAELIYKLDPTIGYQIQSECCGIHDGSPYKYENPMQYFENTASRRGSRVDGFNPEYGAPCIPIAESILKMMPADQAWPINDAVWNYLDGNGFHQVTTRYREAVNAFGPSKSIEEFAKKGQFVGALNFRAIWEVWNYNKFNFGDRWASGFLFWYHNSPAPQTASRMYDWYLEPTAALYYSQNGLAPLHPQFDYLKNTVSVYNDLRQSYKGYKLEAEVYSLESKLIWSKSSVIDIPADGVVNDAIKIQFPENVGQVHFIKLKLKGRGGKLISDAFYWRSRDEYKGAWTMTGPAVSGFEDINKLPRVRVEAAVTKQRINGKDIMTVEVRNPSKGLSFFTQLKLQDGKGNNLAPTFYSDNFFNLLPGETKVVTIEPPASANKSAVLMLDAFNAEQIKVPITQ
ncbi:glycoside hydrolase family 2 [Mucilaginibacter daejeonensis]|uniref:glycoside hydrolase family 2 protein n=1 Tax=Mucilaginibacter daejeonensis TaxID=398049 RepID=UPI001D17054F|nr:sugar-binding domain-containing protein [Mucilaginibacter daejeonensis]UEG52123.1 glycoside hydrolase family 2 [Mucilaginibacter daejeonensis]